MNTILDCSHLSEKSICRLVNNEVIAIRIRNFYKKDLCATISKRLLASDLFGHYINAKNIGKVGTAFYETVGSDVMKEKYFENSVEWISQLRSEAMPYLTPIDKVRLELDDVWPYGSQLATFNNRKMFAGLARVFEVGSGGTEPHQDHIQWDYEDITEADNITSQLALNVYLKVPSSGGELIIWPISLLKSEYENIQNQGSYGVCVDEVEINPIVIKPNTGDLIIFNSNYLHAVSPPLDDIRVSWSCFVGFKSLEDPLRIWS